MASKVQIRRGTTSDANAFVGGEGELYMDLDQNDLRVHDGVTQGGTALAKKSDLTSKVDKINITSGTVGSGNSIPIISYNAQGQITSVSTAPLSIPANIATETYVNTQISSLVNGAPGALDTLKELATALGNDSNFATTVTNSLAGKQATLVSGTNIKTINNTSILGGGNLSIGINSLDDGYISGTTMYIGNKNQAINATSTLIVDTISRSSLTSSAIQNVIVGYAAGLAISSGSNNVYVGALAGYSTTTAQSNVAVGTSAGYSLNTGESNSLFGRSAGFNLNSGTNNTFIGMNSGREFTTGNNNIAIGSGVGRNNIDGSNNTFIAGSSLGSGNTIIGRYSTSNTLTNSIVIADGTGWDGLTIKNGVGITLKSVASGAGTHTLKYDPTTGVVTYDSGASFNTLVRLQQTSEKVNTKTNATGTVIHDFNTGSIWAHSSVSANFTANFTNVPTDDGYNSIVTLIVVQSATAYIPTSVQINGSSQTIKWLNGEVPTGNANSTDVISFSLLRVNSTWTVLGSLTEYA